VFKLPNTWLLLCNVLLHAWLGSGQVMLADMRQGTLYLTLYYDSKCSTNHPSPSPSRPDTNLNLLYLLPC
jgi:hypothetical protein